MQNTIFAQQKMIEELKKGQQEINQNFEKIGRKTLEDEQKELSEVYNRANAIMEAAIAEGDGKKWREAKSISDKAFAKWNLIESQKVVTNKEPKVESKEQQEPVQSQSQFGQKALTYGSQFIKKHSSWYDPSGGNRDTKIVQAIDEDLYNEGFDPESKEYWEELEARAAEVLPHRFKKNPSAQKAKVTVGGSGKESNPASYKTVQVPKEFLQTLKAAGYEQGSDKFKAAVKQYYAQQRKGA